LLLPLLLLLYFPMVGIAALLHGRARAHTHPPRRALAARTRGRSAEGGPGAAPPCAERGPGSIQHPAPGARLSAPRTRLSLGPPAAWGRPRGAARSRSPREVQLRAGGG